MGPRLTAFVALSAVLGFACEAPSDDEIGRLDGGGGKADRIEDSDGEDPELGAGCLPGSEWVPAVKWKSREGRAIDHIVLHTLQGSYVGAKAHFQNPNSGVSVHYVIRAADGRVACYLPEEVAGAHAGNFETDRRSIGIELEGFVDDPARWYTDEAYASAAELIAYLVDRHEIPFDRAHIIGHGEVPDPNDDAHFCGGFSHHGDPGEGWDWARLMAEVGAELGTDDAPSPDAPPWDERARVEADVLAVDAPTELAPGESGTVTVTLRNTGTAAWENLNLRLESSASPSPLRAAGWILGDRPRLQPAGCYGPERVVELSYEIRAPDVAEPTKVQEVFSIAARTRDQVLRRAEAEWTVALDVVP